MNDGDYISVKAVAQLLGVHDNTVRRIPPAEMPFYRLGHRGDRRYHRRDVARYIESRRVG